MGPLGFSNPALFGMIGLLLLFAATGLSYKGMGEGGWGRQLCSTARQGSTSQAAEAQ